MKHLGDFDTSAVVYGKFTTYQPSTGAAFALAGTPALSVYKDNSTTQSTTGVTLTASFDSVTGLNHFAIDTSADGTFYSAGSFFDIVITTGTVDSVSVVGSVVGSFTLRKNSALKPTTAGRTLDVSSGGEAGVDWANVGSPTTTVGLSGTTVKTATDVETDTADIQTRLPAALVSGRIDASVGAMAANVMTAAAAAADLTTELQAGLSTLDAAGVRAAVGLASADLDTQLAALPTAAEIADAVWEEAIADHSGTAGSTAEQLAAAGAAGDPWATALPGAYSSGTAGFILGTNLDATVSSRLASAGYTAPLSAAGTRTAVGLASANLDTQLSAIAGYIDTEVAAIVTTLGTPAGASVSADIAAVKSDSAAILTDTGTTLPATLATIAGYVDTEVAAIKAVTDLLPDAGALTSIATATALATVDTVVDAIKAKTDSLAFTVAGQVDANVQYVNDVAVTGDGAPGTEWGPA